MFLFAVAKGVQRNGGNQTVDTGGQVSIRCREGRTAERRQRAPLCGSEYRQFLFAVAKGVQRNFGPTATSSSTPTRFLFAVAKGVQRNHGSSAYSDRRAVEVSIRCRGGRTAEQDFIDKSNKDGLCFYSLSRRAYSGTLWSGSSPPLPLSFCFYSLSRRAYSGTVTWTEVGTSVGRFLFAVAKGVQRNKVIRSGSPHGTRSFYSLSRRAYSGTRVCRRGAGRARRFYSLSRRAYSGTRSPRPPSRSTGGFLFAVAKGVQRNHVNITSILQILTRFYSLSRRAYSGTTGHSNRIPQDEAVSIRCREGRTAEPDPVTHKRHSVEFLFAVAKGVQRNEKQAPLAQGREAAFLFAVAKGVQRNHPRQHPWQGLRGFLFAVARGVQRNPQR